MNSMERISGANCFPQSKTVYKSPVQFCLFFEIPFAIYTSRILCTRSFPVDCLQSVWKY